LVGGTGDDLLIGAQGDKLTGGGGADTFVFNPNFGKETITDLGWANLLNHNVIAFDKTLFANPTASQVVSQTHDSKAGAVIVVDAHDTVTLIGVTVVDHIDEHVANAHAATIIHGSKFKPSNINMAFHLEPLVLTPTSGNPGSRHTTAHGAERSNAISLN
jgi:hypothetical protein